MYHLEPNDLCLAKFSDGYVYRARLLSKQGGSFSIVYVEYGNTDTVSTLFKWPEVCYKFPMQANVIKVTGLRGVSERALYSGIFLDEHFAALSVENFLWQKLYAKYRANVL